MRYRLSNRLRFFVCSVLVTVGSTSTFSTTIHVPSEEPTIQAGINAAGDGDTVLVAPGTYPQPLYFEYQSIVLRSSGGYGVTFISGTVRFISNRDNASSIEGFTIQDGNGVIINSGNSPSIVGCRLWNNTASRGGGVYCRGNDVTIQDCTFINNYAWDAGAVYAIGVQNLTIDDCLFVGNDAGNSGGAIAVVNSSNTVLKGNLAYFNATSRQFGGFFYAEHCTTLTVVNNTITRNSSAAGSAAGLSIYHTIGFDFRNNIVTFNEGGYGIHLYHVTDVLSEYNDVFGNPHGDYSGLNPGLGSISEDPMFRDTVYADYRLYWQYSPCIDAGDPGPQHNDPDGTRNDIGAFPLGVIGYPVAASLNFGIEDELHIVSHSPVFYWSFLDNVRGQSGYELEVGVDNDWSTAEMWSSGQVTSSDTLATYSGSPLADGATYYYRVHLGNGSSWGDWSEDRFRMNSIAPAPNPIFPDGSGEVGVGGFRIVAAVDADIEDDSITADFEIYGDPALQTLVWSEYDLPQPPDTVRSNKVRSLSPGLTYWWRARVSDGFEYSEWSPVESFVTRDPATISVPTERPTIQAGIDAASDYDTVLVGDGVYTGDGNRDLRLGSRLILLTSENGPQNTIIDVESTESEPHGGIATERGFDSYLCIDGFTFKNCLQQNDLGGPAIRVRSGSSIEATNCVFEECGDPWEPGGAILFDSSGGSVSSCTFVNCTGGGYYPSGGGAISILWGQDVTISDCLFDSCLANGHGGGIFVYQGNANIVDCHFKLCGGYRGGGLSISTQDYTVEDCYFEVNYASDGGGLYASGERGKVLNCTFVGNSALDAGGGLAAMCTEIVLKGCEFEACSSRKTGGGFSFNFSTGGVQQAVVDDCTVIDCSALEFGGGFFSASLELVVSNSSFINNRVNYFSHTGAGGAAYLAGGDALFVNCQFTGNFARKMGGALVLSQSYYPGRAQITDCSFKNDTGSTGGAVHSDEPTVIDGSLFYGNNAVFGSALDCTDSLTVSECTFVENIAGQTGSTIRSLAGVAELSQTLMAFNAGGPVIDFAGADSIDISCTDLFGNEAGDWVGDLSVFYGINGNISADPLFCDPDSGLYSLFYESPCAARFNQCGQTIGAEGVNCYRAMTEPDSLHIFEIYSLDTLWSDFYIGNCPAEYSVNDILTSTVLIDEFLSPTEWSIVDSADGFRGDVLKLTILRTPFLMQFGALYGDSLHPFSVSGQYSDQSSFDFMGEVKIVGHMVGDVNIDGSVDIADLTFLVEYLFMDGVPPPLVQTADLDGSGTIDISDLALLVSYLFL